MYKEKKVYAVYRLLYGEDFIKESIESILDHVDKVFIFWSKYPFYKVRYVHYLGEDIRFPKKFDNSIEVIKSINSDKIEIIEKHYKTNTNQFTKMYNDFIKDKYEKCDILMMIEVDHVFRKDQLELALDEFIEKDLESATTEQWEIWRGFKHYVPQWNDPKVEYDIPIKLRDLDCYKYCKNQNPRKRMCTMFVNMKHFNELPKTGMHCNLNHIDYNDTKYRLQARTHNFGFAKSEKTMFYAHLISLAVSSKIGDSVGNERWYEDVWLNWKPEMKNLEGCAGYEWHIPYCVEYNAKELPKSIIEKFNLE